MEHGTNEITVEYTPGRRLPWWREQLVVLCWRLGQALTILGNRIDRLEG